MLKYICKNISGVQDVKNIEKRNIAPDELLTLGKWMLFDDRMTVSLYDIIALKNEDDELFFVKEIFDAHAKETWVSEQIVSNLLEFELDKKISFGLFMFLIINVKNITAANVYIYSIEKCRKMEAENVVTLKMFWQALGAQMPTDRAISLCWSSQKAYKHNKLIMKGCCYTENIMTLSCFYK